MVKLTSLNSVHFLDILKSPEAWSNPNMLISKIQNRERQPSRIISRPATAIVMVRVVWLSVCLCLTQTDGQPDNTDHYYIAETKRDRRVVSQKLT